MATAATGAPRQGVSVGSTSEFSLFFHVKPGHGDALREALRTLQTHPGYRPGEYHMAIATIHEARFVLFDDDTRLLFATSFDGPWDAYMDDFATSGPTLQLFDTIFQHVEGYEGLPDVAAVKAAVRRSASSSNMRSISNWMALPTAPFLSLAINSLIGVRVLPSSGETSFS